MDKLVEYLKKRITDKMSLENIVNAFEEMEDEYVQVHVEVQ